MKTPAINRSITVGIFIFVGILILVVAIFTLGGQHDNFVKTIIVKTVFNDVSGLQAGNNVWFSGVKVGTIKKISFYGNSQVEVDMSLEKAIISHIRKNAKTKIGSDGLIGNKIVVISGGTPTSPPVVANDFLAGEKALDTDEIMATLQDNNKNILAITTNFKAISKKIMDGEGTIGSLINDRTLVNDLRSTIANFKKVSVSSQSAIANFDQFTSQLNKPGSLTHDLVGDTTIYRSLKRTANQLQQAANTASEFTHDLKNAGNNLSKTNSPIGVLLNDENTAADLKTTVKNLKSSSQKLDEDLEALQHNFLLRGFFKNKAKNKPE